MVNRIFLFLTIILTWSSCGDDFESIPFSGNLMLPTEYSYELQISCFCIINYVGPHKIRIKNNVIVDYELVSGEEQDPQLDLTQFTIDALAKRVDELLAQDPVSKDIELHPDYDFPMSVYIDVDERIADEEFGYQITNFKVIDE